jgi:hypothetical protein
MDGEDACLDEGWKKRPAASVAPLGIPARDRSATHGRSPGLRVCAYPRGLPSETLTSGTRARMARRLQLRSQLRSCLSTHRIPSYRPTLWSVTVTALSSAMSAALVNRRTLSILTKI